MAKALASICKQLRSGEWGQPCIKEQHIPYCVETLFRESESTQFSEYNYTGTFVKAGICIHEKLN